MAVADLAHALEVALGRSEAAAGVLHRLQDHRGHGLRALEEDPVLDRDGSPERVPVDGRAGEIGSGHDSRQASAAQMAGAARQPGRGERSIDVPW